MWFTVFWIYLSPNLYRDSRLLQCSPEMLATIFSVIYKALTLHGNLTELGRLQGFLTELSTCSIYIVLSLFSSFKCISYFCRRDDEEMCILGHWEAPELCCTICRYEACHLLGPIFASCDWTGSFCKWQANKSIDFFSTSCFMLADRIA